MDRNWQRRCIGCGQRRSREQLVRLRRESNTLVLDDDGRKLGRGLYVCPAEACLRKSIKRQRKWWPHGSRDIDIIQLRIRVETALKSRIKRAILVAGRQGALFVGCKAVIAALRADKTLGAVVVAQDIGKMRRAELETLLAQHGIEWRGFGSKDDHAGCVASGPVSAIGVHDVARGRLVVDDIDRLRQLSGVGSM